MLDKLNFISQLFNTNSDIVTYDNLNFYITNNSAIKQELISKGIGLEDEIDRLLLKLNPSFYNLVPYQNLRLFEIEFLEEQFVILDNNGDFFLFTNGQEPVTNDNVDQKFLNHCNNLVLYYTLFKKISSDEFADHANPAQSEIILYSSINGIFKIRYDTIPNISKKTNLKKSITELLQVLDSIELKQFLKNSFFAFSNATGHLAFETLFENAVDIVSNTKRDHELVARKFNFKEFKDSLYKEKEKYFSDIREIINKIFSQAIGIPISISATLFVTYKNSGNLIILLLTLISFIVYISFYLKIQSFYKSDLNEIKTNFNRDFEIIKTSSGLDDSTINIERKKIECKINNSISIVNWLIICIIIMGFIISFFILYQIFTANGNSIFRHLNIVIMSLIFKFSIPF